MRALLWMALSFMLALPALAQDTTPDRSLTGGAQTLEDIMARQRGEKLDDSFRRDATGQGNVEALIGQLGTRGVASDSEVFRALRYGSANTTTQASGPTSTLLIQDSGMTWLTFREGPLIQYGFYLLGGMTAVIALFWLVRGKILIEGAKTGRNIIRFLAIERFAHWLMGISFIILGITGLVLLIGRKFIIPWMGHEAYASIALAGKWVHNNIAWAFMLGLLMVFVMWVHHNIPDRTDLKWLAKGGGLFAKGVHPPAKKFNAGQKIIFWSVIVLGVSISASGLALLFPFELPMFAKTFNVLNILGLPQLITGAPLPEVLSPYEEMQLSQIWHGVIAFVFIAIIIAHIYLGSVGMEGAIDTMATGEVDEQWAKEHHSIWYEEELAKAQAKTAADQATPAE
ncbi:formate dehydrogenase subunit gamma [Shimia sp. MMG029]|uniref:formate dehydrogenase subunit gamma n=1 Tax=Shimia sp. MMG029 TaxID=3021978 RepID=UPI0022FE57F8|nr:formate dehydrogenase subunit gamma [Shimia sp. MMG029]MDA5557509.1 formate dehydrogenase subunit gamma [Shimia sp. MMG029]